MHIISSSQINTLYPVHRNAHYILFQENTLYPLHRKHIISFSQRNTLYPLRRNAHYILFQEKTLYPLRRNAHYILFSEINISSSQINTICPFHKYTQCIIFSDRHTISSFQIYKLYHLYRNTHILFR